VVTDVADKNGARLALPAALAGARAGSPYIPECLASDFFRFLIALSVVGYVKKSLAKALASDSVWQAAFHDRVSEKKNQAPLVPVRKPAQIDTRRSPAALPSWMLG
jgi:hypothetical protein